METGKSDFAQRKKVPPVPPLRPRNNPLANGNNESKDDDPPPYPPKKNPPVSPCCINCPHAGRGVYQTPRGTCVPINSSDPQIVSIDSQPKDTDSGTTGEVTTEEFEFGKEDIERLLRELQKLRQKMDTKFNELVVRVPTQESQGEAKGPYTEEFTCCLTMNDADSNETKKKGHHTFIPVQPEDIDTSRKVVADSERLPNQCPMNDTETLRKDIADWDRLPTPFSENHPSMNETNLHYLQSYDEDTYAKQIDPSDTRLMPLRDECRSKLITWRVEIQEGLSLNTFFDTFMSKTQLSHSQVDRILGESTNNQRVGALLEIVATGSQSMYDLFLISLRETNHGKIHDLLLGKSEGIIGRLCGNLKKVRLTLTNSLRFDGLFPTLIERNVINHCQTDIIRSKDTRRAKANELLDMILRDGREEYITTFIKCLEKCNQRHLAHLIQTGSDEFTLQQQQREKIQCNFSRLTEQLNVQLVLPYMVQNKSFTSEQKDEIIAKTTRCSQSMEFLEILICRPNKAYTTFIDALHKTDQNDIAELLVNESLHQGYTRETPIRVRKGANNQRRERKNSVYVKRKDLPCLLTVLRSSEQTLATTEFVSIFDEALDSNILDLTSVEFSDHEIKSFAIYLINTKKLTNLRINCKTTESLLRLLEDYTPDKHQLIDAIDRFLLTRGELDLKNCHLMHGVHGLIQYMTHSVALKHTRLDNDQLGHILMVILSQNEYLALAKYLEGYGNNRRQLLFELLKLVAEQKYPDFVLVLEKIFLQDRWLKLHGTRITELQMKGIVTFLLSSKKLRNLDLTNCGLTDNLMCILLRTLPHLSKTKKIWLLGNELSSNFKEQLTDHHKDCVELYKSP